MSKFLCIAAETLGLAPECPIVELGWILFDPERPDDTAGDVALIAPESDAVEQDAVEIHTRSGLLAELANGEPRALGEVYAEIDRAIEADSKRTAGVLYRVLWSRPFLEPRFRGAPFERFGRAVSWDFSTINEALGAFTANAPVRVTSSRALNKIAAMQKTIAAWHALFHMATLYPVEAKK